MDEDGHECSGKHMYLFSVTSFVLDHDECGTNVHDCDQHCHNSRSSYYCTCDNEYRLSTNGRSCIGKYFYHYCNYFLL